MEGASKATMSLATTYNGCVQELVKAMRGGFSLTGASCLTSSCRPRTTVSSSAPWKHPDTFIEVVIVVLKGGQTNCRSRRCEAKHTMASGHEQLYVPIRHVLPFLPLFSLPQSSSCFTSHLQVVYACQRGIQI